MTNNLTPQPAGEGGAREATRRILGLREGDYCYARTCFAKMGHACHGCEDFDAIAERVAIELGTHATQPTTAASKSMTVITETELAEIEAVLNGEDFEAKYMAASVDNVAALCRTLRNVWDERRMADTRIRTDHQTQMDWQQVVLNGGPPCFYDDGKGWYCGRTERWEGHGVIHQFVPLALLIANATLSRWNWETDNPKLRELALRIAQVHPPVVDGHWDGERSKAWVLEITELLSCATPTDVAGRARRAAERIRRNLPREVARHFNRQRLADIIAAEFGGETR